MDAIAQYEGTVTPSFLVQAQRGKSADYLRKLPLRLGRVIKVHAPKDDSNRSKKFYEYDIVVDDGSENSPSTRFHLNRCMMLSAFGGAADFTRWTPRELQGDRHDASDEGYGHGSRVLVLCVNASSFGGIILGGVQHTLGEADDAEKKHHFIWQFNGIRAEVDDSGQLHVSYTGKSDEKGATEVAADVKGTSFHLLEDGGAKLHTVDEEQFIFVDHSSHVVSVQAKEDLKLFSEGTFSWESKGDAVLTVGSKLDIQVQSDVSLSSSTGRMDVGIFGEMSLVSQTGLIKTTSLGVHLGLATDSMVKGTTYRAAEGTMHQTMFGGMQAMVAALAGVAASLATAAASITAVTTLHVIPVVGPMLGAVPLAAAGAAVTAASASATAASVAAQTVAAALQAFEAGAPLYLSLKNKLD